MVYWWRSSPLGRGRIGGGRGPGDDARVGGPPLNSYRFHILNGVLNAIAQPFG